MRKLFMFSMVAVLAFGALVLSGVVKLPKPEQHLSGHALAAASSTVLASPSRATQADADAHLSAIAKPYVVYHRAKPDTFWLVTEELVASAPEEFNRRVEEAGRKILRTLEQYAVVNAETAEIARNFQNLRFTVLHRGGNCIALIFDVRGDLDQRMQKQMSGFNICFIPKDRWNERLFPSPFMYDGNTHTILMVALDVPEPFFAGVVFKQFGHANRHRPGSPPLNLDMLSTERLNEEVDMVQLEGEVLDWAAGGKLKVLADQIRARSRNPHSVPDVLMAMTTEDLFELDSMFGLEDAGFKTVPAIFAFFEYYVIFSTIDTLPISDAEKRAQKRDYVRQRITRYSSTSTK